MKSAAFITHVAQKLPNLITSETRTKSVLQHQQKQHYYYYYYYYYDDDGVSASFRIPSPLSTPNLEKHYFTSTKITCR